MRYTLFLLFICCAYYYYYKNYNPTKKNTMYFCGFVVLYIFAMYMYNYQKPLTYKLSKNIYNADKYPIHELLPSYNSKNKIKEEIILKQYGRCHACNMRLHPRFENEYKMMYIIPLNQGGPNEPYNLKVVCPSCYMKQRNYELY